MNTVYEIGALESFLVAISVLFLGQFINRRVPFLKKYKVPEPIVGGLIIAIIITVLHTQASILPLLFHLRRS